MDSTSKTPHPTFTAMANEIDQTGFYPDLVIDSFLEALDDQPLVGHFVHLDTMFFADEVSRHLSVLALTANGLYASHAHDAAGSADNIAVCSVESVALSKIYSVVHMRAVNDPDKFATGGATGIESSLLMRWGMTRQMGVDIAYCNDDSCSGTHGLSGSITGDDFSVHVSEAAAGSESVKKLVAFTKLLHKSIGRYS